MLKIKRIDNEQKLDELLKYEWNQLLEKSSNNSIFLTWEWINTWWETFKEDAELIVLSIQDEKGNLVGIAPLKKKIRKVLGIKFKYIEFIGSGKEVVPDHLGFIILKGMEDKVIPLVLNYFEGIKEEWDIINLTDMREDVKTLETIKNLSKERGYLFRAKNGGICPYIKLPGTWKEYLASLSRKSRYNVGKKRKNLSKKYKIEFFIWKDKEKLNIVMNELSKLHQSRMFEKGSLGNSTKPRFWAFHQQIAEKFFDKGQLFLGVLKANDKIVACQYAFRYNNKLFHYQSGIAPDYSKYSVGLISTTYMVEESIKEKLIEYDFLRGNESYKFHWANNYCKNIEFNIWNKGFKTKVLMNLSICREFLQALKRKIKIFRKKGVIK